jgi:hypothetical protein
MAARSSDAGAGHAWVGWQRMFGCQGAGVQLSAGQQLVVRVLQGPAGWWRVQVPHPEQEACHSAGRTQHAAATFLQTSTHALALACMLQRPLASCNVLACMARLAQAVVQHDVRATHVVPCHASRLVWGFKMCEQAHNDCCCNAYTLASRSSRSSVRPPMLVTCLQQHLQCTAMIDLADLHLLYES